MWSSCLTRLIRIQTISCRLIRIQIIICTRMLTLVFLGIPRACGMFQIPIFISECLECLKFFQLCLNSSKIPGIRRIPSMILRSSSSAPKTLSDFSLSSFWICQSSTKFSEFLGTPQNLKKKKKKKKKYCKRSWITLSQIIPIGSHKQENCP